MNRTSEGPAPARTGPQNIAAAKPLSSVAESTGGRPAGAVSCHAAARAYAAHGWAVLPVAGKRPLNAGGCRGASTDPAVIDGWWRRWPTAGVGIATGGVSGIAVLDVDGELGRRSLAELEAIRGVLPGTVCSVTARGVHMFYAHVDGLRIGAGRYGPGLDHRGDGGYVIAAPSVHPSGLVYRWLDATGDPGPWARPLPGWPLVQLPVRRPRPEVRPPTVIGTGRLTRCHTGRGEGILRRLVQAVLDSPAHQHNTVLHWAAARAGEHVAAGRLDRVQAVSALLAAGQAVGQPEQEAMGTIASGLRKGAAA